MDESHNLGVRGLLGDTKEKDNLDFIKAYIKKKQIKNFVDKGFGLGGYWTHFQPLNLIPGQEVKHLALLFNELEPIEKTSFREAILDTISAWIPRTFNPEVAEQDVNIYRQLVALATETHTVDLTSMLIDLFGDRRFGMLRDNYPELYRKVVETNLVSLTALIKVVKPKMKISLTTLLEDCFIGRKLEDDFALQLFAVLCQNRPNNYYEYLPTFLDILDNDYEQKLFPNRKLTLGIFANRVDLKIFVKNLDKFDSQRLKQIFHYMIDSIYNLNPDAPYHWEGVFPEQKWKGVYNKERVANANSEASAYLELSPHLTFGRVGSDTRRIEFFEQGAEWLVKFYTMLTDTKPIGFSYVEELSEALEALPEVA